jgi:hypothetical protein
MEEEQASVDAAKLRYRMVDGAQAGLGAVDADDHGARFVLCSVRHG